MFWVFFHSFPGDVLGFFSIAAGFVWGLVSCGGFSDNGLWPRPVQCWWDCYPFCTNDWASAPLIGVKYCESELPSPETASGFVCPLCWPGACLNSCPLLWHTGGELLAACISPLPFSSLLSSRRAQQVCLSVWGQWEPVGLKGGQELYEGREGRKGQGNTAFTILLKSLPREEVA